MKPRQGGARPSSGSDGVHGQHDVPTSHGQQDFGCCAERHGARTCSPPRSIVRESSWNRQGLGRNKGQGCRGGLPVRAHAPSSSTTLPGGRSGGNWNHENSKQLQRNCITAGWGEEPREEIPIDRTASEHDSAENLDEPTSERRSPSADGASCVAKGDAAPMTWWVWRRVLGGWKKPPCHHRDHLSGAARAGAKDRTARHDSRPVHHVGAFISS